MAGDTLRGFRPDLAAPNNSTPNRHGYVHVPEHAVWYAGEVARTGLGFEVERIKQGLGIGGTAVEGVESDIHNGNMPDADLLAEQAAKIQAANQVPGAYED